MCIYGCCCKGACCTLVSPHSALLPMVRGAIASSLTWCFKYGLSGNGCIAVSNIPPGLPDLGVRRVGHGAVSSAKHLTARKLRWCVVVAT